MTLDQVLEGLLEFARWGAVVLGFFAIALSGATLWYYGRRYYELLRSKAPARARQLPLHVTLVALGSCGMIASCEAWLVYLIGTNGPVHFFGGPFLFVTFGVFNAGLGRALTRERLLYREVLDDALTKGETAVLLRRADDAHSSLQRQIDEIKEAAVMNPKAER